jgi:prepilin-type N-terminal cleavage/methylation domain-containing protein
MKTSFSKMKKQVQQGFTLVEIAIVLMIIGLLIGGVLRGQELITSARVRNVIDQKAAIQTAYIAFLDRYRMVPGDLTADQALLVGNDAGGGTFGGDGLFYATNDSAVAFQNLTVAGFLSCGVCTVKVTGASTINNSPVNAFGGIVRFGYATGANTIVAPDTTPGNFWNPAGVTPNRLVLAQGANISNDILSEVDRKADDSTPTTGNYRYAAFDGNAGSAACMGTVTLTTGAVAIWALAVANCEAAWLL